MPQPHPPCQISAAEIENISRGRYAPEAAYARGLADLAVLARLLAAQDYMHGPSPTSIDAKVYGFIANIYFLCHRHITQAIRHGVQALPNLVRHCTAIRRVAM